MLAPRATKEEGWPEKLWLDESVRASSCWEGFNILLAWHMLVPLLCIRLGRWGRGALSANWFVVRVICWLSSYCKPYDPTGQAWRPILAAEGQKGDTPQAAINVAAQVAIPACVHRLAARPESDVGSVRSVVSVVPEKTRSNLASPGLHGRP